MARQRVLLFGGSGFIGQEVARRLVEAGNEVTIPTRSLAHTHQAMGTLDVHLSDTSLYQPGALEALVRNQDVVINLAGIVHGSIADFAETHIGLTARIICACQAVGVRRYLHMSALGAHPCGPSHCLRTKGEAETLVRASGLVWTIFRPSLVFGPKDQLLNVFVRLQRFSPILLVPGAQTLFQPIWVGDVARAIATAVDRPDLAQHTLSLVGPQIYSFAQLARIAGRLAGISRPIIAMPTSLAKALIWVLRIMADPPISRDNLDSLRANSIDPAGFPATLGWHPTRLEDIAATWLRHQPAAWSKMPTHPAKE